IHSRTVTRYPANSIVVVGGCPVCSNFVYDDGNQPLLPAKREKRPYQQ
ncbi:BRI3 isoform 7, partial [Pan troglodytes]